MVSNVRLLSNIICVANDGVRILSINDVIARLGYFELLEYQRINPFLFTFPRNGQLTERQRWERDGPRGRNNIGLTRLWAQRSDFAVMPAQEERNPFLSDKAEITPALPKMHVVPSRKEDSTITTVDEVSSDDNLISEQDSVITAGAGEDMLVVAPPGTGKTHVLVERIAYLVTKEMAKNPLEEILVLSFTRSAVAEVRKRLMSKVDAGGHENMLYAQIRTFDSFATNCLKRDLPADRLVVGYSERIAQFNQLITGGLPQAEEQISKIKFLLVDEVQDLNGERAGMVLELARRVNASGGCSIFFGDPAQAIYDFTDDQGSADTTSIEFLENLILGQYCGRAPKKMEFSQYRRFETPEMLEFVSTARVAMGEDGLHPDGSRLDELLRTLGQQLALADLKNVMKLQGRKALLTRTNLEAYFLWDFCNREGIPARLWRGASGNYWPGWVGRLVLGFQNEVMSVEMAQKRWIASIQEHVALSFSEAMTFLQDQGVFEPESGHLQVAGLNNLISNSAPVQQTDESGEYLVISTIHRSKGLEFENVLLYSPSDRSMSQGADEMRVVYVASTRAKRKLQLLRRDSKIVRFGQCNGQYLKTSRFHVNRWPEYPQIGLLVDGSDVVDIESVLDLDGPLETQKSLWAACAAGSRNVMIRNGSFILGGARIGQLSASVARDIGNVSRLRQIQEPASRELNGLKTIDIATVSFDPDNSQARSEFGAACLGIVPVVSGIVSI